jgi:hypothetical protein
MHYTTLDTIAIVALAVVAGIQFLRSRDNISQVLYEMLCFAGAAYAANRLFLRVHEFVKWSTAVSFVVCFVVLALLGVVVSALLNAQLSFSMGAFNYIIGLLLAVVCAYAIGHAAMKTYELGFVRENPVLIDAMARSWVARELLHFRTALEVLVFLRFVRWKNM